MHLSTMRTYIKRVRKQLEDGDVAAATETLPLALGAIHRAASKGVIHQNTASRYVSRLSLALNRAS
jgi:small subunit ribosomal protein S20